MRPDIVQTHPFIDQWRAKGYQYYVVPKAMLRTGRDFGLSMDEVMLYVILRDRANLSFENKWIDEHGHVYIIYTREEAAKYLGWSVRKTITVFASLVKTGLLTEVEQKGNGVLKLPKRLYVHQWAEASVFHPLEEIKKEGFAFLTENNIYADTGEYYSLPQCLLQDPIYEGLGLRAALVYMMALDNLHLSIKYGKVDENGLVWCSLDTKVVCHELGCDAKTLGREYKTLETLGLIVRKRNGANSKTQYRIYLRDYLTPPRAPDSIPQPSGTDNPACQDGQNCTWGKENLHLAPENTAHGDSPFCTWNTENSHIATGKSSSGSPTNLHASQPSNPRSLTNFSSVNIADVAEPPEMRKESPVVQLAQAEMTIRRHISYAELSEDILTCAPIAVQPTMLQLLDLSIRTMAEDAAHPGSHIRLGEQMVKKSDVMTEYKGIDRYILYTMLEKVSTRVTEIRNVKLYLHQALYHAVRNHSAESFYTRLLIEERRAHHEGQAMDEGANFW